MAASVTEKKAKKGRWNEVPWKDLINWLIDWLIDFNHMSTRYFCLDLRESNSFNIYMYIFVKMFLRTIIYEIFLIQIICTQLYD